MNLNPVLIILAVILPSVSIPVFLGLRHDRWKRKLEHEERMRAMEIGRPWPGEHRALSPAAISLSIGVGVPLGVFILAPAAARTVGFQQEIWIAAAMVGVTAVICGTLLASQHFAHLAKTQGHENLKPRIEEDAYDVVSSRN